MKLASIFSFRKILLALLIASPILVSSFYLYGSIYSPQSITIFLTSLFTLIAFVYVYAKRKAFTPLDVFAFVVFLLVLVVNVLMVKWVMFFEIFGKGVIEWTAVSLGGLLLLFASFIHMKDNARKIALVAGIATLYTVANFFIFKYLPNVATYTAYLNVPMLSFARIDIYAFYFTLVVLASSLLNVLVLKYTNLVANSTLNKITNVLKYVIILVLAINVLSQFRHILSYKFYDSASKLVNTDTTAAGSKMSAAIAIMGSDLNYNGRAAIISQTLAKDATAGVATTTLIAEAEEMLNATNKAIAYDSTSPDNYINLAAVYEKMIYLKGESEYQNAIDAYNKAKSLATGGQDKIEIAKAKLAFTLNKEEEGVNYINEAFKINRYSPEALLASSQYAVSKKDIDTAINYAEKSAFVAPDAPYPHKYLGLLYTEKDNLNKAVASFSDAYRASAGSDIESLYYITKIFKAQKDTTNFEAALKELTARVGTSSEILKEFSN